MYNIAQIPNELTCIIDVVQSTLQRRIRLELPVADGPKIEMIDDCRKIEKLEADELFGENLANPTA